MSGSGSLTMNRLSVSASAAEALVSAAQGRAQEIGNAVVIVVCDVDGLPKALLRMDGASSMSLRLAHDKAATAASFGVSTEQWFDLIKDDGALLNGVPSSPGFSIIGGGYPLRSGGQLVGAIGVSGGAPAEDVDCARTAAAALGFEA